MGLQIFWFLVIAVLWCGFFVLEGFDFGVGVLHWFVGKNDTDRRVAINTIGPFWDANEVWLIVAGAGMFAAFPGWYATMFSALYLPLVLILIGLIVRGVSFEWRGKRDSQRWRTTWSMALVVGGILVPLLLGVGLGDLLSGLPIDEHQEFTGNFWNLLTAYGLWTGVTMLALCLLHGATFLMLQDHRGRPGSRAQLRPQGGLAGRGTRARLRDLDACDLRARGAADPAAGHRRPVDPCRGVAGRVGQRGVGVRRDRVDDRLVGRVDLRRPVSERDGVEHEPRVQPHGEQQRLRRVRAEGHDRGRRRPVPGGAGLSELDVLRVPQARDRPAPAPGRGCRTDHRGRLDFQE